MSNSFLSLLLVAIGGIFLLQNFNQLPPDFWQKLLPYSPIILIILGLNIYFEKSKRHQILLTLITLLGVSLFIFVNTNLFLKSKFQLPLNFTKTNPILRRIKISKSQYNIDQINSVTYEIKAKNNRLSINDSLTDYFLEIKSSETEKDKLIVEPNLSDSNLVINLNLPSNINSKSKVEYPLIKTLSNNLESIYKVDLGQGVIDLKLSKGEEFQSNLNLGLGSLIIDISESTASGKIKVNLGTGLVKLKLNSDQKVEYDIGFGTVLVDETRQGSGLDIKGNNQEKDEANKVIIEVQIGMGSLVISRNPD